MDNKLILDELFGSDRNVLKKDKVARNYWDEEVCKYNLVSMCFNDLWKHTKYDTEGECKKRHDQHFLRDFQADKSQQKLGREQSYVTEAIKYIQSKIREVDKIIKKHQFSLEQKQYLDIDRPKDVQDRLQNYEIQMKKLLEESEKLGEAGKLEESERLAVEADNLKKAQQEYLLAYESSLNPYQTSRVCEICGAKQALQETERKQQTHLEGKIHQGFAIIRAELEKLLKRKDELENQIEEPPPPVKEKVKSHTRTRSSSHSNKNKSRSRSGKKRSHSKKHKKQKNKKKK